MKLVSATVVYEPEQLLGELKRRRDIPRPRPRDVLGSWLIWLRCPEIALEAQPGQFVMVGCGGDCTLPRPFSIHRVKDDSIALFFAVWEDGKGTKWLSQRRVGDRVEIFGPLGNGFSTNPGSQNLLLVAGGIGIAPLTFLAEQVSNQGYKVRLLRGASGEFRTPEEPNPPQHYPEDRLPRGIEVQTITTDAYGRTGMVLDLITEEAVSWANQVFACGPTAMYREMAIQKLPKPVQVSLEVRMGCGYGVCYGCTVKTKTGLKQVCTDGPVFALEDILWDELGEL